MNKVLKGLVAVAATAAMAVAGFAGASTATADEATGGIQVDARDTHSYTVYQIFTGTYGDGSLGNVKPGTDFKTENGAGDGGTNLTAAAAAEKLAKIESTKSAQEKLTEILKFANLSTPYNQTDLTAAAPLTNVPAGYYLAKDKDGSVTGNDAQTLYIVKVVGNEAVTITRKADKPTLEKKVKDTNDSTGSTTDWQDSADYDFGDKVPFQLTATLPANKDDFAAYKTYKLVFTDNQSVGLTYPEASGFIVKYGETVVPASQYTLILNPTTTTADSTFTLTINDVKSLKDADGSDIAVIAGGKFTVEYESTLNDKAVIGSTGNPNEAKLQYSNNPNYTGEGADSPTGETPKDKVVVFTYQLNVNKTFDQGNPADGDMPKFKLFKKGSDSNYTQVGDEITLTKGGTTDQPTYTGSFSRIDDGEYKLVESHTPAGYNTAADKTFTITADHDTNADDPKLNWVKIDNVEGTVNTGAVQVNIENKKGSNLPSTGGMGTVLLYVAGIAVFVLAGATLVMALRRRNA
ncbi:isopeptide-forming domain-containing fimbrial protein [Bifidobacterium adolescentis]|uniref:FimA fimbrial subunit-like protein n=1 Tax=Bifidobacterium adolescentis TaxID=1680 RepID=A0A1X2ZS95_BIFAD|nr:isopeptide-forming domain-containing fimbrial protein [Bifidobacterium adolescentis]OSG97256.1 FimA fimbrial subunit-like protein [Bifidobacterium adolescentis]